MSSSFYVGLFALHKEIEGGILFGFGCVLVYDDGFRWWMIKRYSRLNTLSTRSSAREAKEREYQT